MTTYVTLLETGRHLETDIGYVGPDPDEAKRVCDEEYVPRTRQGEDERVQTFIQVWDDGEHQCTTRHHPEEVRD